MVRGTKGVTCPINAASYRAKVPRYHQSWRISHEPHIYVIIIYTNVSQGDISCCGIRACIGIAQIMAAASPLPPPFVREWPLPVHQRPARRGSLFIVALAACVLASFALIVIVWINPPLIILIAASSVVAACWSVAYAAEPGATLAVPPR